MKTFLPLLLLCLFYERTLTNNVSSSEVRHGRVSGRIVKLYSGIKPEPIMCPKEGFQADPVDCAVFYRCVKGSNDKYTVFRYQCGPGTVYDPDNEICNHPRSTKRVKCGGYATSLIEPVNENDIDGSRHEVPSPISTKPPVYADQSTNRRGAMSFSTIKPWSPSSDLTGSDSTIVSTAYPWVTTTFYKQYPKATNTPVTQKSSSKMDDMCSSDGFMGDTENCRKFYRCVGNGRGGYIRYEFSCSELTIWDDETQACNHPWAVKKRRCGRGNSDDDENMSPNTKGENEVNPNKTAVQSQLQISYGSKVNQVQTQIASGSVIQNQTQINYGDRSNKKPSNFKQNQTQISHGAAVSQTQTQISHGNDGVQTQLQIDHTNKSSQSQTQVLKTTTEHTNAMPQQDETKPDDEKPGNGNGSNDCVESGFMGDSNDCNKFYRCVDNGRGGYIKYEFSCGEGTVWDRNAEACNHAWAVKDCKNQSPSETTTQVTKTTTTTKPTQQSSTMETTTSDDEDVGYNNQNQQQTMTSTTNQDKPSTSTQSVGTTTTVSSTTQKTSNTGDGDICTSSGFVGDTVDCRKFYRCVDNGKGAFTKYEYKCGEGTVWDSEIEACNHAWAVKKCGSTSDAGSTEKTTTTNSVPTTTMNSTQTTTEPASSTTTTKKPDNSSTQGSDCTSSGFIGDKDDCKKFYRCVDNGNGGYTRYEFSCGDGTVWDPKLEACNHVWAVEKCGGKAPGQNTHETTSHVSNVMQDEEVDDGNPSQGDNNTDKPEQTTISNSLTTTPSESPSLNDNSCQSSGFKEDKNDCKKFYRCVDDGKGGYIRYDFSCGEGTIWDQSIESCNHPSSQNACKVSETATQQSSSETTTQSSSNTQSTTLVDKNENDQNSDNVTTDIPITNKPTSTDRCSTEGFFGDTKDCKKFYRCVGNQQGGFTRYDFTCGEGTMWDSEINACNHAKSGKNECNAPTGSTETTSKQPENQTNSHENDENVENTSQVSTSETTVESGAHQQETGANNICESEGFFASSNSCKKFYRCVNDNKGGYTKYDFTCGEGTIWDQQAQTCNHESSQIKCAQTSESSAQDKPQSQPETTTQSQISSESTSKTTPPTSTTSTSNDQCTADGFYANSKDCKKFYRCVSNDKGGYTKYDFTCGEGTIWVQEIQACDHDNDIDHCSTQSVSTTPNSQSNQEEQPATTASSTAVTAQSITPEKESDEMPNSEGPTESNNCESEGFYPNKHDCRKFYRCVDDGKGGFTMYDFTCGDGTAWDSDIQGCNHISEVKNCQESQNQSQSETATSGTSSQTTESTGTTKITTESSGENKPPMNGKCQQEGYFGESSNCQKFYRCVDNGKGGLTKYDYTCGEGTIWDQEILACNHPRDVQNPSCTNNSSATTESSSSATTTSTSSSSTASESSTSSSTESQGSSNCSQSSTPKPQNKKVNCTKAGFYADPDDCKKFYRCVDWDSNGQRFSVYHFDCGEGTIWDPELETCNHEDSVYPPRDCSGTQAQTQNTTDESTTSTTTTTQKTSTDKSTTQESSTTEQPTTENATTEETTQTASSTTEPATTQQATTTESSTTQSSTTTEQTTTQQSTTTEQTTTSEKSTTQQSTTSEQTTTQQSTTSEQTTTQQSTTTEQTTTEQSATSEQTTTQQSTTSDQTTTEQSATSEQTTTQHSTTSDQTTTEQSATSEQTTTQQSTTSDQTTTEQSATSEQTTTQQSTSSEQSTTEQATTTTTTEQSTTEQSTSSEQSTTEQSTTEQTTAEQTTENSTDQSSTTTEESSTTEQTTDLSESSTTETSTTEQSSDSTTTDSDQQSTTESSSSASEKCPETEDDQYVYVCPTSFRRHPKYCNMFYQCTEDSDSHDLDIAVFKCPNNTIYDESQAQCVDNDKADKKCDGEIAERRRVKRLGINFREPIVVSKEKLACSASGHFPFEKSECSPGFLKCDHTKSGKLRGYVHQCPKGYVYWSISRRCEVKSNVRDCKLSANDWSGRSEIPIERNNVAN